MGVPLRIGPRGILLPGNLFLAQNFRIDWTHPLATGLQSFCVPDGKNRIIDLAKPREAVGSLVGFRRSGPTISQATMVAANTSECNFTAAPFSLMCRTWISSATGAFMWGRNNYVNETNNQGYCLQQFSSGGGTILNFCLNFFNNNGAAVYRLTGATSWPVTADEYSVAATNDGTTRRLFVNGKQDGSDSNGLTPASNTSVGITADPQSSGGAELYFGGIWNRVLTPDEVVQLHYDPFCLLRAPDWIPNLATGAITVAMRRTLGEFGTRIGSRQIMRG